MRRFGHGWLVRPLLGESRAELRHYADTLRLPYVAVRLAGAPGPPAATYGTPRGEARRFELVHQGAIPGPDVVAAGVFVTPDLGETLLADPRLHALAGGVNTDEELELLVDINADRGVDVIKTRGTQRAGLPDTDPRQQVYSEHQLRVIVERAAGVAQRAGREGQVEADEAEMNLGHFELFLQEKIKTIKRELGQGDDFDEILELKADIDK